jgi:polyisoprenoid-binding protein YceI
MKLMNGIRTAALVLVTGIAVSASAQTSTWKIDTYHSGVEFRITHMGISHVSGKLSGVTGTVTLDEKDITKSSVTATIDATTVDTGVAPRDNHLKSADFFNVAQFPTLSFTSTKIVKEGGKLKLIGDLTLAGVTKPVTLLVDGPAKPQPGQKPGSLVSGLSAAGTLSRKDFNFGAAKFATALGDEVTFTIDIEMAKQ